MRFIIYGKFGRSQFFCKDSRKDKLQKEGMAEIKFNSIQSQKQSKRSFLGVEEILENKL